MINVIAILVVFYLFYIPRHIRCMVYTMHTEVCTCVNAIRTSGFAAYLCTVSYTRSTIISGVPSAVLSAVRSSFFRTHICIHGVSRVSLAKLP